MKIGFTGTRNGMTLAQRAVFCELTNKCTEFHHGCCIGADSQAGGMIEIRKGRDGSGPRITLHPPIDRSHRDMNCFGDEIRPEKSFHVRDRDIVDETDFMIATPKGFVEEWRGSGTWSTVRYARKKKKPITIIFPDGSLKKENITDAITW